MSNISSYSLIDDDHIDDQETINVGNLIIDLENDLEKEKIENEQANAKSSSPSATSTSLPSSSTNSSSFAPKPSSSGSRSKGKSGNQSSKSSSKSSNRQSSITPTSSTITSNSKHNSSYNKGAKCENDIGSKNRTLFSSSSDEKSELKMKITRESKPAKSEHKTATSPNQKLPTSSGAGNSSKTPPVHSKRQSQDNQREPAQPSSISSTRECGTSTSTGTITEPECLGPCEPGTSVSLEGIVWQETDGGILVINVTWRGKTYVGALLDCTKHDWAPPQLCDSPTSDIEAKAYKGIRSKRIITRSNGVVAAEDPLQVTGKLRNGKGRRPPAPGDLVQNSKRPREVDMSCDDSSNAGLEPLGNLPSITSSDCAGVASTSSNLEPELLNKGSADSNSPSSLSCSEVNCSKRFRNRHALMYHQTHAHGGEGESDPKPTSIFSNSKDAFESTGEDEKLSGTEIKMAPSNPTIDSQKSPQEITGAQSKVTDPEINSETAKVRDAMRLIPPSMTFDANNRENRIQPTVSPKQLAGRRSPTEVCFNQPLMVARRSPPQQPPPPPPPLQIPPQRHHLGERKPGPSGETFPRSPHCENLAGPSKVPPSNIVPPTLGSNEEGMKPSGTSTGPPPAPHQANYYFNSAFLADSLNSYGLPPHLAKPPLLPYDPLSPATSTALSRLMSNMGIPEPTDPSLRLPKNSPFPGPIPPFRMDQIAMSMQMPMPNQNPPLSNLPPMPPIAGGSPHLRPPPGQLDQMLNPPPPPLSFPMAGGLQPPLGLPNRPRPTGPGAPQMPNLGDSSLAEQFSKRYN